MNERQITTLRMLLNQAGKHLLVQDIADKLGCSEKTVRSDLKEIEKYLAENSQAILIRKPGLGVYLEMSEEDHAKLFDRLNLAEASEKLPADEERAIQIAYHLLMNSKPITVQELSERYFLNKAVVKQDLNYLEKWMDKYSIKLITKQNVGLIAEGTERNKRVALARISELLTNRELNNSFIQQQFSAHEIEIVKKELNNIQKRHSLFFTDEAREGLTAHILLMIKRTKLKQSISMSSDEISNVTNKKEYKWAQECLLKLEQYFSMKFPDEEFAYLTLHLLGGKFRDYRTEGDTEQNPFLDQVTQELVIKLSELCMVDFQNDTALKEGLQIHLYTTLNRLKYGLSVSNPMLQDIKKLYPYMFDMVIHVLEEVNQIHSLDIPEEEAGYLTLHFQASIERLKGKRGKTKNILIVCHMGVGMSRLLRTKIEQNFHSVHVAGSIARADLASFLEKENVDLVISTVSLPESEVPHIVVSPLLTATDEKRLQEFIKKLENPEENDFKESVLLKYTTPFLVFLKEEYTSKYELIEKLANTLYKKGYAEKEYSQNAILREKMSATSIGSSIAIPHGHPSFIKHSAIAVATLKNPIDWGSEKVSIVFMLAIKNDNKFDTQQLFREISYLSSQPAAIQKLVEENEIVKFLSHYRQVIEDK
ncbi:BglG family transcription antiterminator [Fictibacillus nanhaiensis]|uniref:BglG family transcription antiterminator n=1 Tax=Fictibacillus nanhaiensis TaxID=742169 RepID=UPI0023EEF4F5|nr:BglG family transcription antiterminator [Fictibacillus nanhaiensis]